MLILAMDCWQQAEGNVGNEANREITWKQIMPAATLGKSRSGKFVEKSGEDLGGFQRKSKPTTASQLKERA